MEYSIKIFVPRPLHYVTTSPGDKESKAMQKAVLRTQERKLNDWDALLERRTTEGQ